MSQPRPDDRGHRDARQPDGYSRLVRLAMLCLLLLPLTGCAAHGHGPSPYGFFSGIWHGLVFPYALMAKLLSFIAGQFGHPLFVSIELVGRPNEGPMYYLGYFIGLFAYVGARSTRKKIRD